MKYRINVESVQEEDGRWFGTWQYEVGPCRGGPCGTTAYFLTERHAIAAAITMVRNDLTVDDAATTAPKEAQ